MTKQLELVGIGEIEEQFKIPRRQVHRLEKRGLFPQPVAHLKAGKIWDRTAVARALHAR